MVDNLIFIIHCVELDDKTFIEKPSPRVCHSIDICHVEEERTVISSFFLVTDGISWKRACNKIAVARLILIAYLLEVIRVRRTLVWCYLTVCTAIELIVLWFAFSRHPPHHWIFP